MTKKVCCPQHKAPAWPRLVEQLAARSVPLQMRMIDGQLAFPDEAPPDDWRELRVSTPGGMITLRRESDGINLVIWGNADENLLASWNTLASALAEMTGGTIAPASEGCDT